MRKPADYTSSYHQIGPYIGLGTQLAASVILMFFLGRWLDSTLSTTPLFIILFSFLGSAAGIYNFIKSVLNLNKKTKNEK
jgi:F0F1-type ATP synthase assembly protein I